MTCESELMHLIYVFCLVKDGHYKIATSVSVVVQNQSKTCDLYTYYPYQKPYDIYDTTDRQ
jgi:hypothetical protein